MRLQVEVRREDEDPLRGMAFEAHRSVREQAAFLLHVKIQELAAELKAETLATESAA